MPNQYRKGTAEITLRIPEALKDEIKRQAESSEMSVNRFIRDVLDQSLRSAALRQRVLNPLRGSPRRRPRDPAALFALAWNTRQRVLQDTFSSARPAQLGTRMTPEEFVRFVDAPERLLRQIRAAAVIADALVPTGLRPVVVGGSAVEFYTSGSYTTVDS